MAMDRDASGLTGPGARATTDRDRLTAALWRSLQRQRRLADELATVRAELQAADAHLRRAECTRADLEFLADLSTALTSCATVWDVVRIAAAGLQRHLGANRVTFSDIHPDQQRGVSYYSGQDEGLVDNLVEHRFAEYLTDGLVDRLRAGEIVAVDDVDTDPGTAPHADNYRRWQVRAMLFAPYVSGGRWRFLLLAHKAEPYPWQPEEAALLREVSARVHIRIERARAEQALRAKDAEIRQAYADVIELVTGGKLLLMTPEEIDQALGEPVTDEYRITGAASLPGLVRRLRRLRAAAFPGITDASLLIDPAGEAAANAVKHAGGGTCRVHRRDGYAQVRVCDHGPGIDFASLPRATLLPGFSTTGTLGHGFTVMLSRCDRILLSTRPEGTTLVLETRTG